MSKIDVRLEYQKKTGLQLNTINRIANDWELNDEIQEYIDWLEEIASNVIILKNTVEI